MSDTNRYVHGHITRGSVTQNKSSRIRPVGLDQIARDLNAGKIRPPPVIVESINFDRSVASEKCRAAESFGPTITTWLSGLDAPCEPHQKIIPAFIQSHCFFRRERSVIAKNQKS